MYVTEVIPIAKIPLPSPQVLTYFTSQKLIEGSLALIPLRKKEVPAIVLSQKKASETKMEVKRADFKLKPILKVIERRRILLPYQIELAKWISNYYWAPLGKTISLFLPNIFLRKVVRGKIKEKLLFAQKKTFNGEQKKSSSKLYIAPSGFLPKKEIKTVLSQKKQILFLIPEKSKSDFWVKKIKQVINHKQQRAYDICFSSTNSPTRKYLESFERIKEGQSQIIIGPRSALFAPFSNLGLIFTLEAENKNYKSVMEPRYNAKDVAEKLANILGIDLILISSLPVIEDYVRSKKIIRAEEESEKVEKVIIDMKKVSKISRQDVLEEWSPLSPLLLNEVKKNLLSKRKVLLLINRKGEGLSVVCQDCGWIKKCKNCDAPLILHRERSGGKEFLSMVCYHCGFKTLPPEQCEKCRSWRLITLGSGIEKIERELKEKFKDSKILRLDSDIAPRRATQKKILKEFFKKDGDILVTTTLLLQYLAILVGERIPLIGVVSIDSLLSLPDFRSEEEGAKIIHNLLSLTLNKFILQTFWPNSQVANFTKRGADSFLKELLRERERFSYPPFSKLIKLTFSHKDAKKAKSEAYNLKRRIEKQIEIYNLSAFAKASAGRQPMAQMLGPTLSFIPKIRGKYRWNILIKLKTQEIKGIRKILTIIPPQWKIDVDPLSIL